MDDQIDAVSISTPDHMHFLPACMAIMLGKHVFVQKPLTQTIGEAREVNIWTDRPSWPQGMSVWPTPEPLPAGLDWDCFLGRAPERGFSREIHPFKWRGYRDYGCGAISYPKSAIVEYQFPARGTQPPVKLTWHEGGLKPAKPAQLEASRELGKGGQLIVGSKATVYDGNDYCNSPRLIPEELHRKLAPTFPPKTIPRVPGGKPHKEWTDAIRANNPAAAGSNFEYAVPFTEMVCLGTMSILTGGKFSWDPVAMETSSPAANQLLYPTYRRGWSPKEILA